MTTVSDLDRQITDLLKRVETLTSEIAQAQAQAPDYSGVLVGRSETPHRRSSVFKF